eukprot:4452518-Amphidinium_carterae.1
MHVVRSNSTTCMGQWLENIATPHTIIWDPMHAAESSIKIQPVNPSTPVLPKLWNFPKQSLLFCERKNGSASKGPNCSDKNEVRQVWKTRNSSSKELPCEKGLTINSD